MPTFIPFEPPKSKDGKYYAFLSDEKVFVNRRIMLGLSQQEVADRACVTLRQYQRLESGDISLRKSNTEFALAVCAVLLLDPYEMTGINIQQPDPSSLAPQYTFDYDGPDHQLSLHRPGRKPIDRNAMKAYLNYPGYSLLIPYDILAIIGNPNYIQLAWNIDLRRILIYAVDPSEKNIYDVPKETDEDCILAFPKLIIDENPINAMQWEDKEFVVDIQPVRETHTEKIMILIDLKKAHRDDSGEPKGTYMTPKFLTRKSGNEKK